MALAVAAASTTGHQSSASKNNVLRTILATSPREQSKVLRSPLLSLALVSSCPGSRLGDAVARTDTQWSLHRSIQVISTAILTFRIRLYYYLWTLVKRSEATVNGFVKA